MWYLPPFLALFFLLAAYGLAQIGPRFPAAVLGIGLVLLYSIHIPFSFYLEKVVQREIEDGVGKKTGVLLNSLMAKDDSVFLEPLGFIGMEIRGKTTYDYPGLSSPTVVRAIRSLPQIGMGAVIDRLRPSFAVLRPAESAEFQGHFPETFLHYKPVARIRVRDGVSLEHWGYRIRSVDTDFTIYKYEP